MEKIVRWTHVLLLNVGEGVHRDNLTSYPLENGLNSLVSYCFALQLVVVSVVIVLLDLTY